MGFSEESGLSYRVLRNIFRVYFLCLELSDNGRKKERVRCSTELFTNKRLINVNPSNFLGSHQNDHLFLFFAGIKLVALC